jgi:hypothetical protein
MPASRNGLKRASPIDFRVEPELYARALKWRVALHPAHCAFPKRFCLARGNTQEGPHTAVLK